MLNLKALLVECIVPRTKPRIDEVSDIAKAAGYNVVGQVVQHRDFVDSAYCVGEGKIGEIAKTVAKDSIEAVIFTRQLSAGQIFRIKKKLGEATHVLDRNLLVLEVFEKRTATPEAKLQIALARLRYTFSWGRESIRMRGIISEQMGRGGPGRYPYEAYEAMSRKRISKIEGKLRDMRSRSGRLREQRGKAGFRIVSLTGYTQSGKTTLFNRLASESKDIGLGPFTTLSTFARKVSLHTKGDSADSFIMIDSIGFIEDLSPLLLRAFHTSLNELANSDLILLFVDGSEEIETVVRKVTASHEVMTKEIHGVPVLICINKVDLTTREHLDKVLAETRKVFEKDEMLEISSKTGANLQTLLQKISEKLTPAVPVTSVG
ncbi:MAG: GTPase HflX [Candidatus Bathyarchaeia archaeon]